MEPLTSFAATSPDCVDTLTPARRSSLAVTQLNGAAVRLPNRTFVDSLDPIGTMGQLSCLDIVRLSMCMPCVPPVTAFSVGPSY